MTLTLIYLVLALIFGIIAFFAHPKMPNSLWLIGIAALPQLAMIAGLSAQGWWPLTLVMMMVWGYRNRTVAGVPIVLIGVLLNLVAIAVHQGSMPVHANVLADQGITAAPSELIAGTKDIVVTASPVWWLADWIVIPIPTIILIASPGDLIFLIGILVWFIGSGGAQHAQRDPATAPSRP